MDYEGISIARRVSSHAGGIDFSLINVMFVLFLVFLIIGTFKAAFGS